MVIKITITRGIDIQMNGKNLDQIEEILYLGGVKSKYGGIDEDVLLLKAQQSVAILRHM